MLRLKLLQEKVSLLFYHHGLLCASHPFAIISLVITIVMFMCYPLINLPLPGNAPQQFVTPVEGYTIPPSLPPLDSSIADSKQPRWYFGAPVAYIQQIIVRAAVLPWNPERLVPSDAYRASLSTVFELLEHIDNFQHRNGSQVRTLSDLCLRVAEVTADKKSLPSNGLLPLLPEYNCLQLSPARFWYHDKQKFMSDPEIVNTVLKSQDSSLLSIKDLLLGVPSKIAGIKKYYMRNRQRVVTYAVTIVYKKHQQSFVSGLRDHLLSVYPLSSTVNGTRSVAHLVHVHYRNHNYIVEYTPLMLAYVVLCLYLYFSVRKIEMVKSKWGLALSAMITVFASLLMSMSLCVFFGLTPSLSGSEIFPYLVVVIGLENILVVTKSVVSTPVHLDVKLRIALGLQNEGWYMFRHLVTELVVLAVGFFTFVPAIQEFCLFAVLGLGSDFFLQMFFFTTVLSIDIRRMELSDLQSRGIQEAMRRDSLEQRSSAVSPLSGQCPVVGRLYAQQQQQSYAHTGTHACPLRPGATLPAAGGSGPARPPNVHRLIPAELTDDVYCVDVDDERPPPLMRLLNEWAQYRVFQRGIMVCVIIWILLIVYKTGLIEDIEVPPQAFTPGPPNIPHATVGQPGPDVWPTAGDTKDLLLDAAGPGLSGPQSESIPVTGSVGGGVSPGSGNSVSTRDGPRLGVNGLLVHDNLELWKSLSPNHWKQLFSYYNMSLLGRYITVLPSIHLSISVSPDVAVEMRHPDELAAMSSIVQQNLWGHDDTQETAGVGELTADGGRSSTGGGNISNLSSPLDIVMQRLIRYPRTKLEFVLTILLGIASLILLLYTLLEMYKCVCSRNYAKWRASWQRQAREKRYRRGVGNAGVYYTEFREAVPLVLNGHRQEVECIVCDGQLIVSSCLGGEIRVWDSVSGDCLQTINRSPNLLAKQRSSSPRERFDSDRISDGARTPPLSADPLAIPSVTSPFLPITPRSAPSPVFLADSLASSMESIDVVAMTRGKTQRNSIGDDRRKVLSSSVGHSRHRSIDFALSQIVPNLAETIDTDFMNADRTKSPSLTMHEAYTKSSPREIPGSPMPELPLAAATPPRNGYDFTHFQSYFDEHRRLQEEQQLHQIRRRAMATGAAAMMAATAEEKTGCGVGTTLAGSAENIAARIAHTEHRQGRSISIGDSVSSPTMNSAGDGWQLIGAAIWCLACKDNLIVAGCRNGSIEFWDASSGQLLCSYHGNKSGVIAICLHGSRAIAARVNGVVDFLQFATSRRPPSCQTLNCAEIGYATHQLSQTLSSVGPPPINNHMWVGQTPSGAGGHLVGSGGSSAAGSLSAQPSVVLLTSVRAHQQPINAMKFAADRVLTASNDHTLKVYRADDAVCLYTLHGHTLAVSALTLEKFGSTLVAASGSEDTSVRLWDVATGTCLHKLTGHEGAVTSVAMTTAHVVSVAVDDRLCVWDADSGALLHCLQLEPGYCNAVAMLTRHLIVTGGQGCLHVWDVSKGALVRVVPLCDDDVSVFVRQLHVATDNNPLLVCDYGPQLRVIRFTSVLEKDE